MKRTAIFLVAAFVLSVAMPALGAIRGSARMPALYRSCRAYNKKYPHGVGKLRAHDRTRSRAEPVTNFRRSTRLYRIAMSYNKGLDRDKDGIACEKL